MKPSLTGLSLFFSAVLAAAAEFTAPMNGTTEAQSTAGKIAMRDPGAAVEFVPGIAGNKAARFSEKAVLSYPLDEKYFNPNSGMVSFRFRPLGWGNGKKCPGDGHFLPFFVIDSGRGSGWTLISFFSWRSDGKMKIQVQARGKNGQGNYYFQNELPEKALRPDEWGRAVFIWNNMDFSVYINGKKIGEASYGLPVEKRFNPKWKLWVCPRQFWKGALKGAYEIADLSLSKTVDSPAAIEQQYMNDLAMSQPVLSITAPVPQAKTIPQIDGRLAPGEWEDATQLPVALPHSTGMFNGDLAGSLQLKHDGKNLLLAVTVPGVPAQCKVAPNSNTVQIFTGDTSVFDIWWKLGDTDCQLGVTPNGSWAFRNDKKWGKIYFRRAGYSDLNGWSLECAIPFAEMGIAPGKVQEMNFCFARPEYVADATDRWVSWNCTVPKRSLAQSFGKLNFAPGVPAIRIDGLQKINFGEIDFTLAATEALEAKISSDVAVKPTSLQLSSKAAAVSAKTVPGNHHLRITAGNDFRCEYKFAVLDPIRFEAFCHAEKKQLECRVDARGLNSTVPLAGKVRLVAVKDGKCYGETTFSTAKGMALCHTPLPEIPAGDYRVEVSLNYRDAVWTRSQQISRPSDEFLHDRKGLERTIPFPFAALKYDGHTISTAFIRYQFAKDYPFPTAAVNRGVSVLTRPVSCYLVVDGKNEKLIPVSSASQEKGADREQSSGVLRSASGKVEIRWQRTAAYDGMLKYELILAAKQPVSVSRFGVSTELNPDCAVYCLSPNLRTEWQEKKSCNAFPSAWLTGYKAGFTFFTDCDVNWVCSGDPLQMRRRDDGTVTMTAAMIQEPVTVNGEVPYTLAMMATPSKPVRSDWRKTHSEGWSRIPGQNLQILMGCKPMRFKRCHDLSQPIDSSIKYWKKMLEERPAHVTRVVPYIYLGSISDRTPAADWYGSAWERTVDGAKIASSYRGKDVDGVEYSLLGINVCHNKTASADYICYYLDKILTDYPHFSGLYTDGGDVYRTDTPYQGKSLKPVLSMKHPVRNWEMFGKRDVFERFYKIIRAHRGEAGLMYNHNWDVYYPALLSFHDLIFPGEEYMHTVSKGLHVYIEETPLEKWQSCYNSIIYGAGVQFLGQWRFFGGDLINLPPAKRAAYTRPVLMMCLLHDVPLSGSWYPDVEQVWKLLDTQNVQDAEFVGYWFNKELPAPADPKVKLSFYRWSDRPEKLLILGNLSRTEKTVSLTLPAGSAVDALTGETVDLKQLKIVGPFGFRLLLWKPEKAK